MDRQFSTAIWSAAAAILSILALQVANGSPLSPFGDPTLVILGASFVLLMIALAVVSVGTQMRLSLQLLAIYFTIYLLLPGYNHASTNRFPFFNFSYPPDVRASAAWMVAIFLAATFAGYVASSRSAQSNEVTGMSHHVRQNFALGLWLTVISAISMVAFLAAVGLSGAFAVRTADNTSGLDTASIGLLTGLPRVITFLPIIYALLLVAHSRYRAFGLTLLAINLPILLVVNFPLSIARSQLFGNILLFAIILINFSRPSRRGMLSLAFVFGALVAMPVLDHFTRQGGTLATLDPRQLSSTYFSTGDFDGFQSVNNAVIFVERFGLQYGIQLLSAFLFFVPRAIWPHKAEPTGAITAESAGYTFTNISQPLPSEFYVDFGWLGVAASGLILGWLFQRFDRWVDRGWASDPRTRLAAGWLIGFGLPVYRGTLLGVLPPFLILAAGLWVVARWGIEREPETFARSYSS
jgi:hypothetical protein